MPHLFADHRPPEILLASLGDLGGAIGATLLAAASAAPASTGERARRRGARRRRRTARGRRGRGACRLSTARAAPSPARAIDHPVAAPGARSLGRDSGARIAGGRGAPAG